MPSAYIVLLQTRRAAIVTELSLLNSTKAGGKPNIGSTDGGTTVDHVGYKDGLYRELKDIDELLRNAADTEAAINAGDGGPFEIQTNLMP